MEEVWEALAELGICIQGEGQPPPRGVQQLAGHSDIKTTKQFYLSVQPEDVANAQALQETLLGRIPETDLTDPLAGQDRFIRSKRPRRGQEADMLDLSEARQQIDCKSSSCLLLDRVFGKDNHSCLQLVSLVEIPRIIGRPPAEYGTGRHQKALPASPDQHRSERS